MCEGSRIGVPHNKTINQNTHRPSALISYF
jgi:hypothetical protein